MSRAAWRKARPVSSMSRISEWSRHPHANSIERNFWGRTRAIVSVGHGMTTLDEVLVAEAAKRALPRAPQPNGHRATAKAER